MRYSFLLLVLCGAAARGRAQAIITINFDDIAAFSLPAEQYAGLGVHFGSGPNMVENGITNGDSGGWQLDGTVGPYFLGFNGSPSYSETITFDTATTGVSLDVSRSAGSAPTDTFTLTAFAGVTQVASQTVSLLSLNSWQNVGVLATGITSIQISGAGAGFHPYGIDHLQIGITSIPEPSVGVLLGLGLLGSAWLRRRTSRGR